MCSFCRPLTHYKLTSSPLAVTLTGSFPKSKQYVKWGVIISVSSGAMWILVESILCPMDHYKMAGVIGYIPGHAVWHIGMSYGLSLLCIWFITMDSVLEKADYFGYTSIGERIIKCPGHCKCALYCNQCLNVVFPVITNNKYGLKEEEDVPSPAVTPTADTMQAGISGIQKATSSDFEGVIDLIVYRDAKSGDLEVTQGTDWWVHLQSMYRESPSTINGLILSQSDYLLCIFCVS